MMPSWLPDASVIAGVLLALCVLVLPRLRASSLWRATVTPLASIIGSGFLVLAPLLLERFGSRSVWVMALLCLMAYAIGAAIRWNIVALQTPGADSKGLAAVIEHASSWALAFAYVISVCYYLNLLGAFAVSLGPLKGWLDGRIVTSVVLALIAGLGVWRGLRGLERAETFTVSLKLAVIAGLLVGMALFVVGLLAEGAAPGQPLQVLRWSSVPFLFGLVITVQGFETSRYLGKAYDATMRVRSMRYAQWLSALIYVVYIGLAGLAFSAAGVPHEETAVIDMMTPVASVLPALLVVAALAAQFSAAVADTNGCGGLVEEMSAGRMRARYAYVALAAAGLLLTWTADIYQIISYASRAFAFYYTLQCALAAVLARRQHASIWRVLAYTAMAVLMLAATVFGVPAE